MITASEKFFSYIKFVFYKQHSIAQQKRTNKIDYMLFSLALLFELVYNSYLSALPGVPIIVFDISLETKENYKHLENFQPGFVFRVIQGKLTFVHALALLRLVAPSARYTQEEGDGFLIGVYNEYSILRNNSKCLNLEDLDNSISVINYNFTTNIFDIIVTNSEIYSCNEFDVLTILNNPTITLDEYNVIIDNPKFNYDYMYHMYNDTINQMNVDTLNYLKTDNISSNSEVNIASFKGHTWLEYPAWAPKTYAPKDDIKYKFNNKRTKWGVDLNGTLYHKSDYSYIRPEIMAATYHYFDQATFSFPNNYSFANDESLTLNNKQFAENCYESNKINRLSAE